MKKRKLWFRIIAIVLAALMLGSVLLTTISSLILSARAGSEMDSLEAQQEENERERERLAERKRELASQRVFLQGTIRELQDSIASIQAQKEEYDRLILVTEQEMDVLVRQIAVLEEEILYKQAEYDEATLRQEEQWTLFCRQLRDMEEQGDISYAEILFDGVTSFAELLSQLDMIDQINAKNEASIRSMEDARLEMLLAQQELLYVKNDCESKKVEQQELKKEYENLLEESTKRIAEMEGELEAQIASEEQMREMVAELERQIRLEEQAAAEIQAQIEELERLEEMKNAGVNATGSYLWPSASSYYVTSRFGSRFHPILGYWRMHNGIDIGAAYGTDIYASDGGVVVTSSSNYSYGEYIMIAHGNGRYTLYAHMSKRLVSVDDTVKQGQVIGKVGSTGQSTGPHIHFEIYEDEVRIDPLQFFSNYVLWE